jgi:hypothetical protein
VVALLTPHARWSSGPSPLTRAPPEMGGEVDGMSESWQRFELHATRQGETTCIALLGEFDLAGVEQLEEELRRAEREGGRLVLDLHSLKFTDSTGSVRDSLGRGSISPRRP